MISGWRWSFLNIDLTVLISEDEFMFEFFEILIQFRSNHNKSKSFYQLINQSSLNYLSKSF